MVATCCLPPKTNHTGYSVRREIAETITTVAEHTHRSPQAAEKNSLPASAWCCKYNGTASFLTLPLVLCSSPDPNPSVLLQAPISHPFQI